MTASASAGRLEVRHRQSHCCNDKPRHVLNPFTAASQRQLLDTIVTTVHNRCYNCTYLL